MSLTFKGPDLDDFLTEFEQSTAQTRREAKKVLYQGAKDVAHSAKRMAPVDTHDLEQAIRVEQVRLNQDYILMEVGVDDPSVDDYALLMHENLLPFGAGVPSAPGQRPPTLGPGSEAKDATNDSEHRVGGKFLERSLDLHEERIVEEVADELLGIFK